MTISKRSLQILAIIGLLLVCGGLGYLAYLNGNFNGLDSHRAGTPGGAGYNLWAQDNPSNDPTVQAKLAARTPTPQATARPIPTALEFASLDDPSLQNADWHSVDPQTENAVRVLLSSNAPGPIQTKILPLPAQYRPGLYNPLAPPTISFDTFSHFLQDGGSPAWSEAASLYNTCLRLYCDPAVALAFFQHESSMGRAGAASDNKSWGNIRCTPGSACRAANGNGSFKVYSSWTDGLIDWAILMRETYAAKWQLFSLEQIIPRYAPSADNNDPNGYINTVRRLVDKFRNYRPDVTNQ